MTAQFSIESPAPPNPTELDLFLGFLSASVRGFGGVFVMGRRMLVEERRWLTPDEFVETLGLCQFLPGANIVNMSVAVGQRFRGWTGSLAALAGILVAPAMISVALAALFLHFAAIPQVSHAMGAVAAAAAGLIIGTAAKMAGPVLKKDGVLAIPIGAATFLTAGILHWPLIVVLLVMAPAGIALAWWRQR
jgi:chromate transporter